MGGNTSTLITAAIGGVIAIVIALVVYPILQSAADTYYLEYVAHCEIGNESFLRAYDAGEETGEISGDAEVVNASGTNCMVAGSGRTDGDEVRSEHGKKIGTWDSSSAVDFNGDAKWVNASEVLSVYAGISTLILSILPILAVTGFLGISASNIYQYTQGGSMGIQQVVVQSIAALIITIVGIYLAPTIMDFLNDVYLVSTDDRYGIMAQFNTIISLVLGFTPVVYNAGLLGMFAYQGVGAYKKIRGGTGM